MKILFKISNEIILTKMLKKKLKDEQIINFLLENKDFFLKNSKILNQLKFPFNEINSEESNTKIISFKDWIIKNLKSFQKDIIENAEHNFLTQKKIHNAILQILKIYNKEEFFMIMRNHLHLDFELELINIVTSDLELSKEYNLIYKRKELIDAIYGVKNQLIMDAVDKQMELYTDIDLKIYSNAIFSLNTKFFNDTSLLIFGSNNKQFLNNKAYDLLFFLSKVIQEKLNQLSNE